MAQRAWRSGVETFAVLVTLFSAPAAQILFGPAKSTNPLPSSGYDSVGVADVDNDGLLDLLNTSYVGISWHQGDGTGAFVKTGTLVPGVSGDKIRLVDLNGDGRRDLLAVTPKTTTLQVALARAAGFDPPVDYPTPVPPFATLEIRTGDADADGDADVMVVAWALVPPEPGEAWLMLNDGHGTLTRGPIVAGDATHVLQEGVVASVDGDPWPDLILATISIGQPPETTVWQGQPGGGLAASFRVQGHVVSRAADLDADGDVDLVAWRLPPDPSNTVSTFFGDGRGDFAAGPVNSLGSQADDLDLADFDDDGLPDLVVALSSDEAARWLRGDGSGDFGVPQARVTLEADSTSLRVAALDDFDLDGRPDVLFDEVHHSRVKVSLNETYPSGGPLLDLGHQLAHNTGWPIQIASGSFVGGEPFAIELHNPGYSFSLVFCAIGFSVLEAPFKGGTMVPMPQLAVGPIPISAGTSQLAGNWPTGVPPGAVFVLQWWTKVPWTTPHFGASSGLRITTP